MMLVERDVHVSFVLCQLNIQLMAQDCLTSSQIKVNMSLGIY